MHRRLILSGWLVLALVALGLVLPAAASAQGYTPTAPPQRGAAPQPQPTPASPGQQWEWTFPEYIGNVGLSFSFFPDLPESNGSIGVSYRHLNRVEGPFYAGFEIAPFSFGAVYDSDSYAALNVWFSRVQFIVRFYTDVLMPEIYFEFGAGPQYTRFTTTDNLATIEENGYAREDFGRWRLALRFAAGLEFNVIGVEFGYTIITPGMEMFYSVYTPTEAVHAEDVRGMLYFAVHFRFDSN